MKFRLLSLHNFKFGSLENMKFTKIFSKYALEREGGGKGERESKGLKGGRGGRVFSLVQLLY